MPRTKVVRKGNTVLVRRQFAGNTIETSISHQDLFEIARLQGEIEEERYPRRQGFRGSRLVLELVALAIHTKLSWGHAAQKIWRNA